MLPQVSLPHTAIDADFYVQPIIQSAAKDFVLPYVNAEAFIVELPNNIQKTKRRRKPSMRGKLSFNSRGRALKLLVQSIRHYYSHVSSGHPVPGKSTIFL